MAREIETISKLKGVEAKAVSSFFEERLGKVFGKFSANRANDSLADYSAGAFLKPYGVKARLKLEDIGNDETLAKMSARPKLNAIGIVAIIFGAVLLLVGIQGKVFFSVLGGMAFFIGLLWELKKTRKQIVAFFDELKIRFS